MENSLNIFFIRGNSKGKVRLITTPYRRTLCNGKNFSSIFDFAIYEGRCSALATPTIFGSITEVLHGAICNFTNMKQIKGKKQPLGNEICE